jgi:hypothetical protein
MPSHVTRGGPASASARTAAPASASRKIPSGPTSLSAFHSIGLWLAVRISPAPAWWCSTASCVVGVGTTPRSMTSAPTDISPAVAARANIGPLVRESRPTTTSGRPARAAHAPNAAACRATSSGVRSVPTCPRIPDTLIISVPDMAVRPGAATRWDPETP